VFPFSGRSRAATHPDEPAIQEIAMVPRRLVMAVFALAGALLVSAGGFAQEKVLLRCAYKAGDRYLAVMDSDRQITQELGDQTNKVKQTMRMDMGMEVLSVDAAGTAEVKFTHRRIALKMETPRGTLDYDSGNPEKANVDHPMLIGFKVLVGKAITITMTNRGEVKAVKGVKEIMEGIVAQIPEGPERENARKQLAAMMDEERFSQQMTGFSVLLPVEPVGIGESWKREQKTDLGFMNVLLKTDYKVEKIAPDAVEVAVNSKIDTVPGATPDPNMSIAMKAGSLTGTTKINRANAALYTGTLTQNVKMDVTTNGRTEKRSITGTATVTVKPEAAR
jgi:hypothetical protein